MYKAKAGNLRKLAVADDQEDLRYRVVEYTGNKIHHWRVFKVLMLLFFFHFRFHCAILKPLSHLKLHFRIDCKCRVILIIVNVKFLLLCLLCNPILNKELAQQKQRLETMATRKVPKSAGILTILHNELAI